MEGKICPILSQGFIAGINGPISCVEAANPNYFIESLPKCLEKNCALWVNPPYEADHCGLRKAKINGEE